MQHRAPSGGAFGETEWQRLFAAYRVGGEAKERAMRSVSDEEVLEQLLWLLGGGSQVHDEVRDSYQISALVLLQENAEQLLDSTLKVELLTAHVLRAVHRRTAMSLTAYVRAHMLVSLTHVFLQLGIVHSHAALTEQWVQELLGWVTDPAESSDRYVRGMAAQCLEELEDSQAGLLVPVLPQLYEACRLETTHSIQSLISLFSAVLSHAVLLTLSAQSSTFTGADSPQPEADDPFEEGGRVRVSPSSVPKISAGTLPTTTARRHAQVEMSRFDEDPEDEEDQYGGEEERKDKERPFLPPKKGGSASKQVAGIGGSLVSLQGGAVAGKYRIPEYVGDLSGPAAVLEAERALLQQETESVGRWSASALNDVRRSVALVFEHVPLLWDWAVQDVMLRLRFVQRLELPADLVRHHTASYVHSMSVVGHQCALNLLLHYRATLGGDDVLSMVRALLGALNDPQRSPEARALIAQWLTAFAESGEPTVCALLRAQTRALLPSVFDPLAVVDAKVRLLVPCAGSADELAVAPLLRYLPTLDHALFSRRHPRFVLHLCALRDLALRWGPRAADPLFEALWKAAMTRADYEPAVALVLDELAPKPVGQALLRRTAAALARLRLDALPSLLRLVRRVMLQRGIHPAPLLERLLAWLCRTGACAAGDPRVGSELLDVCRAAMVTHAAHELELLPTILRRLAAHYAHLLVRDRARLYARLLSHLGAAELARLLSGAAADLPVFPQEAPLPLLPRSAAPLASQDTFLAVSSSRIAVHFRSFSFDSLFSKRRPKFSSRLPPSKWGSSKFSHLYSKKTSPPKKNTNFVDTTQRRNKEEGPGVEEEEGRENTAATATAATLKTGMEEEPVGNGRGLAEHYLQWVHKDPGFGLPVPLRLTVGYLKHAVGAPPRLFGIRLRLRGGKRFGPIEPLLAPLLDPSATVAFAVTLWPTWPALGALQVSADYCDEAGDVGCSDAGVVPLEPWDFVWPLAAMDAALCLRYGRDAALPENRHEPLFDALWASLHISLRAEPTVAAEAIKRIDVPRDLLLPRISAQGYCVARHVVDAELVVAKLLYVLAPRVHLLVVLRCFADHAQAIIRMDHFHGLVFTDPILNRLYTPVDSVSS